MRAFLEVIEDGQVEVVDCGTCPVSLACAVGEGGTGWVFPCCGATAVGDGDSLLVLDCQRHRFERRHGEAHDVCGLCSGDVVTVAVHTADRGARYVPTVHAKVDLPTRLAAWREKLPAVSAAWAAECEAET